MMLGVNRMRRVLDSVHTCALAIGSIGRTRRRGRVTVAILGIECARALIGRQTVLLEAAGARVDFNNALIKAHSRIGRHELQDRPGSKQLIRFAAN
jgi:hypothetical protein